MGLFLVSRLGRALGTFADVVAFASPFRSHLQQALPFIASILAVFIAGDLPRKKARSNPSVIQ